MSVSIKLVVGMTRYLALSSVLKCRVSNKNGYSVTRAIYCTFQKYANSEVQDSTMQLRFSPPSTTVAKFSENKKGELNGVKRSRS